MTTEMFIGLDYGTGKIGVAVGQLLTGTASVQAPIINHRLDINWSAFERLITIWHPVAWVVGIPMQLDGTRSTVTRLARRFVALLKQHFAIPVYTIDEQLTTQEAKRNIYHHHGGRGLRTHSVDSAAAKLILEAWLQQMTHQTQVL